MLNSLNVKPYNNKELLLFPPSIGDYLPDNHLAHVIDEAVEEIDLSCLYKKIPSVGNPSYHPALMTKIWFYGYVTKTYSSRKIAEKSDTDVAFIYLAGMQKPDFRTISDFRKNNLEELKKLFIEILQICHRLGMVKLSTISLDSKVMKANAAASQTYDAKELTEEIETMEKEIKDYLERANQTDLKEDNLYGAEQRGDELPKDIQDKKERIKKIKEVMQQLKQAQEKLKKSDKEKINITDEDAQFQKDKTRILPGYRGQAIVDCQEQVIIANDVSPQQDDSGQLIPMTNQALQNIEQIEPQRFNPDEQPQKIKLLADGGYSSGDNLAELEKEQYRNKIDPYLPVRNSTDKHHRKDSPFHRSKFIYNQEENSFLCPAGQTLNYEGRKIQDKGVSSFLYSNKLACQSCPHFKECVHNQSGRIIQVSEHQPLIDNMRHKLSMDEGKTIYGKRKSSIEPVFGNISHNLGFREFLLRTLNKVKGEFSLLCTAHNLLKIARRLKQMDKTLKEALKISPVLSVTNSS
jgi:transposase